jgi:CDP-paratose 2-epimerase
MRLLITGGAGFVGGNVSVSLATRHPEWEVVALDNLHRRGSELNVPRLRAHGVRFIHGDVRQRHDLLDLGRFDTVIEASAEPSVLAGRSGGADYLVWTNLVGAINCLELCRRDDAHLVFLSTSRVYPMEALRGVAYSETDTRFELGEEQAVVGVSSRGIAETFPLGGARSLYGATKLAAELLIAEYASAFRLRTTVVRCGVVAGPWQMGKVDQGVFSYWVLAHQLGKKLAYLGYRGTGKQVRDVIHIDDLTDLLAEQIADPEHWRDTVFNVGGGTAFSLSLLELTEHCRAITGRSVHVAADPTIRPDDVPIYVSDCSAIFAHTEWRPQRQPTTVLEDISEWAAAHEKELRAVLD